MHMPGLFARSKDGIGGWELREQRQLLPVHPSYSAGFVPAADNACKYLFNTRMRHCAVLTETSGETELLHVFWSQVGDRPERILCTTLDISSEDWSEWRVVNSEPRDVLAPELSYEGADQPLVPSVRGQALEPVNQLRDPCIFVDRDGEGEARTWLMYACAGESGIGLARLSAAPVLMKGRL